MATLTTLIPAHKKEHLAETFAGLARQTFRDFKVILSDDSPGDERATPIQRGEYGRRTADLDLTVVRGPKNAHRNDQHLIDLWDGGSPHVHMQLDDDAIHPDFYRTHLAAHAGARLAVPVSRRWITQDDSRPAHGIDLPQCVARGALPKYDERDAVLDEMYALVQRHGASLVARHDAFAPFWPRLLASDASTDAASFDRRAARCRAEPALA